MSNRNRDSGDIIANIIFGIIGFVVGGIAAAITAIVNKDRSKPKMPDSLEPVFVSPRRKRSNGWLPAIGALLLIAFIMAPWLNASLQSSDRGSLVFTIGLIIGFGAISIALLAYRKKEFGNNSTEDDEEEIEDEQVFSHNPKRYIIKVLRNSEFNPDIGWRFVESLIKVVPHAVFRIIAEQHNIYWEVLDWRSEMPSEMVIHTIHGYYPSAEIEVKDWYLEEKEDYPIRRFTMWFQQAADFVWPIKSIFALKDFDPLVAITQAMSGLEPGEKIIYSLVMSIFADYAYEEGKKMVTVSTIHPLQFLSADGTGLALATAISGRTRTEKYRESDQKIAREKLNGPLYQSFLGLQFESPSRNRVEQFATMDMQVWQFENSPYNSLVWVPVPWPDSIRIIDDAAKDYETSILGIIESWIAGENNLWKPARLILSPQEIASIWHLPDARFEAPEIRWAAGRRVPAPAEVVKNNEGIVLGTNSYSGKTSKIHLSYPDRETHTYIVGKTGVGKSTLIHNMIHQDIANGKGVGVIDPHGSLVRDILRSSIPAGREDDVVIVDFANHAYPPPLNPFSIPEDTPREVAISNVMGILKKIYADEWSKTRMESAIYSSLVALLDEPNATPRDISKIFLDDEYRRKLLLKVNDPVALEYWYDEYENLSPGVQKQTREPVLNRIRIFYRNAAVRNMVCHPHSLDFRKIINDGKIFLASLRGDETRSEQANLGAMLITNFQMAAMGKGAISEEVRDPYYLFIDEVQEFVTTTLPIVLSQARKFGLRMTAANQFLGQLKGQTLESILGNVGGMVIFTAGPDDARALAPFVRPEFTAEDLMNFDRFHTAVKIQVNKQFTPAFSLNTPIPIPVPDDADEREERIRNKSIKNYTPWSKEEVEQWFAKRYPRPDQSRIVGEVQDYD